MLISATLLRSFTDHLAATYDQLKPVFGSINDNPAVVGTVRNLIYNLLQVPVTSADVEIEGDLDTPCNQVYVGTGVEAIVPWLAGAVSALSGHCSKRGSEVSSTINGLTAYLNYLNTAPTGSPYASLLAPGFQDLYGAINNGSILPPSSFYHRAISPDAPWSTGFASGMGTRAVGGAFGAGGVPNLTLYAEVNPLIVVTTTFVGGTAAPQIVLAGTDSNGATTTTWTLTLDSNNPASPVTTTITPAILAQARQTVALASASGIIPGSLLVINAGLPDQETVLVETVAGSNITAVFFLAHNAGATVTGKRTYAPPPSVAGVRMRSLSNITINVTGHTAGAVRVDGGQDRRAI